MKNTHAYFIHTISLYPHHHIIHTAPHCTTPHYIASYSQPTGAITQQHILAYYRERCTYVYNNSGLVVWCAHVSSPSHHTTRQLRAYYQYHWPCPPHRRSRLLRRKSFLFLIQFVVKLVQIIQTCWTLTPNSPSLLRSLSDLILPWAFSQESGSSLGCLSEIVRN